MEPVIANPAGCPHPNPRARAHTCKPHRGFSFHGRQGVSLCPSLSGSTGTTPTGPLFFTALRSSFPPSRKTNTLKSVSAMVLHCPEGNVQASAAGRQGSLYPVLLPPLLNFLTALLQVPTVYNTEVKDNTCSKIFLR